MEVRAGVAVEYHVSLPSHVQLLRDRIPGRLSFSMMRIRCPTLADKFVCASKRAVHRSLGFNGKTPLSVAILHGMTSNASTQIQLPPDAPL